MKSTLLLCGAVALAGWTSSPVAAAVTYTFEETGAFFGDATFTYVAPTFLTGRSDFVPQACAVTPNANSTEANICAPTQRAEAAPTSFNVNADYIGFNFADPAESSGGTGFFFFAPDAFRTNGTFLTMSPSDACTPGHGCVGNAGSGTLTVAGVVGGVPEPESWALMFAGFVLTGTMLRRRTTVVAA